MRIAWLDDANGGRAPAALARALRMFLAGLSAMLGSLATLNAQGDTVTVAVASNFAETFTEIAAAFEAESGHEIVLVRGSSGRHFAQIINGAPFDLFLSADAERPARLVNELGISPDRLQTYVFGRLALWAGNRDLPLDPVAHLRAGSYDTLAIANPRLAPYGAAAMEVLNALDIVLPQMPDLRLVQGENIAQAHQFVASGNADLGFVALSQVIQSPANTFWIVPEEYHAPIAQQLVILTDNAAVRALVAHLGSLPSRAIIEGSGYRLPATGEDSESR